MKRFRESGDVKPSLDTGRKRFACYEAVSAALALLSNDARPSTIQVARELEGYMNKLTRPICRKQNNATLIQIEYVF